jgi:hypothetical protein
MSFKSKNAFVMLALVLGLALTTAAQNKAKQSAKSKKPAAAKPATIAPVAAEAEVARMTVEELKSKINKNEPITIIDSRSQGSYDATDSKIKGAIRIPTDEVESRLKEIPRDKAIVIYCT